MAFTNNPQNPLDRVRIRIGDTDTQNEYLTDYWYAYFLENNSNNETLAAIEAAKVILVNFTSNTREKTDQVEIWGNDQFDNYLKWLKDFIENPSISGLKSPSPYAGGISISDMEKYKSDSDCNTVPFSVGEITKLEIGEDLETFYRL